MTTVSQIITDAYRESNLIAVSSSPTSGEEIEGLRILNRLIKSVFGFEAGEVLKDFPLGNNGVVSPTSYPDYGNLPSGEWFAPLNVRFVLNLDNSIDLPLNPSPDDGSRFGVLDVSGNLSTNNVTIKGNGRRIETLSELTLSTDSVNQEWFYRGDLGNWVKFSSLLSSDDFPFPEEFEDMFIIMLAMRINPRYTVTLDPQSLQALRRSRTQFRARYAQKVEVGSEKGLIHLTKNGYDRQRNEGRYYSSENAFEKGITW